MVIVLTSDRHLVRYAKLRSLDRWHDQLLHELRQSIGWRYCVVDISDFYWIRYVTKPRHLL
jgi:hypothetical protein